MGRNSTANIELSDDTVLEGDTIVIAWSSTGASTCSGANFSTGDATAGVADATPPNSIEYTLLCGDAQDSATVTVLHPSLTIVANPNPVRLDETTVISWNATNVDSCSVSEDNSDFIDAWSG
ncbi:MAG: hypothetical protein MI741_18970, partial [Rhodospirillales bacterium]|nr:hypothetical protein [Rhodospirillales bacterium]